MVWQVCNVLSASMKLENCRATALENESRVGEESNKSEAAERKRLHVLLLLIKYQRAGNSTMLKKRLPFDVNEHQEVDGKPIIVTWSTLFLYKPEKKIIQYIF